jgi:hypothetical protein
VRLGDRLLGDAGVVDKEATVAIDALMITVVGHADGQASGLAAVERAATPAANPVTG